MVAEGNNIPDLLPNDRCTWDIHDALNVREKGRKPAQDFINAINKYPLMSRAMSDSGRCIRNRATRLGSERYK